MGYQRRVHGALSLRPDILGLRHGNSVEFDNLHQSIFFHFSIDYLHFILTLLLLLPLLLLFSCIARRKQKNYKKKRHNTIWLGDFNSYLSSFSFSFSFSLSPYLSLVMCTAELQSANRDLQSVSQQLAEASAVSSFLLFWSPSV